MEETVPTLPKAQPYIVRLCERSDRPADSKGPVSNAALLIYSRSRDSDSCLLETTASRPAGCLPGCLRSERNPQTRAYAEPNPVCRSRKEEPRHLKSLLAGSLSYIRPTSMRRSR